MMKRKKIANHQLTHPNARKQTATRTCISNERSIMDNKIHMRMIPVMSIIIIIVSIYLSSKNGDGVLTMQQLPVQTQPTRKQSDAVATDKASPGEGKLTFIDPIKFGSAWDLISHFSKDYDLKGLHYQLKQAFDFNERAYDPAHRKWPLQQGLKARGAGFDRTTRHKLNHDLKQFDYYFRSEDVKLKSHGMELFGNTLLNLYRETLHRLDQSAAEGRFDEDNEFYIFGEYESEMLAYYNRAMFLPTLPSVQGPLLSPRDWAQVERQWFGEDAYHPHPGIVVVDNLLSPQVLNRVRKYLLLSTFWYKTKLPRFGAYLRAYINDGMYDSMMAEIAFDLHKAMPRVMDGHPLKEMWAYKYESSPHESVERTGIHVHADDAMVNVNLWITPDQANLDPNSGGLVVYMAKPPREWSFSNFNSDWEYADEHILRPSGYANVTIPYKQNRAVIFDSFLFHKSDILRFKQGYENRRMNLTFLYGSKQSTIKDDK